MRMEDAECSGRCVSCFNARLGLLHHKNIFSHSDFTTHRNPFIGLGRTQGRKGRRSIDSGFRGLGLKSWCIYVTVGKSVRLCLFSFSCETGQRIHVLAELLCSFNEVMNMKQLFKLKSILQIFNQKYSALCTYLSSCYIYLYGRRLRKTVGWEKIQIC